MVRIWLALFYLGRLWVQHDGMSDTTMIPRFLIPLLLFSNDNGIDGTTWLDG
jgi:hypothetical protein